MSDLTAEQEAARLQETINAAIENRVPDGAAWGCPDTGGPITFSNDPIPPLPNGAPAPRESVSNILTAADLGPGLQSASEYYEIPGTGKGVWVHPCSGEEAQLVARWAPHVKFDMDPDEGEAARRERIMGLEIDLAALEVIAVCRTGPERAMSTRCFTRADVAAVKRHLPYLALKAILAISNRLAQEGKPDTEGLKAFFTRVQSGLTNVLSLCATSGPCPDGLAAEISALRLLAQRLASVDPSDIRTLSEAARE